MQGAYTKSAAIRGAMALFENLNSLK